jgi:heptosyltransferase I
MNGPRILIVRLGAMGDIIHALPAVASLKHSLPHSSITWIVEPRWTPLLDGNPCLDHIIQFERGTIANLRTSLRALRRQRFDFAVDFQGLIKSALVASAARADRIYGFDHRAAREPAASWFYSHRVALRNYHAVERNLDLAAGAGATSLLKQFPLPPGIPEGNLPDRPFVLASPQAGWGAKQWPLEYYSELGARLRRETGMPLVLNGATPIEVPDTIPHVSGLAGLIDATRRASAVVGVDSGPLHLAAALGKPGVAIYGPTEPERHGPYGETFRVLRSPGAVTTYRRSAESVPSMREITPEAVFSELEKVVQSEWRAQRRP